MLAAPRQIASRLRIFSLILLASSIASTASADGEEPTALGRMRVEDSAIPTSTATRSSAPLIETPQSITVIDSDQIAEQNAQTMQEVLRYTAGVRSDMYGLDNRGDWFTLRGGSEGSSTSP